MSLDEFHRCLTDSGEAAEPDAHIDKEVHHGTYQERPGAERRGSHARFQ